MEVDEYSILGLPQHNSMMLIWCKTQTFDSLWDVQLLTNAFDGKGQFVETWKRAFCQFSR